MSNGYIYIKVKSKYCFLIQAFSVSFEPWIEDWINERDGHLSMKEDTHQDRTETV